MMTNILAQIIYIFIRILNATYRYEFIGLDNKLEAKKENPYDTYIYALWHQNLIGAIFSHIGEKFTMVVSASKDGELVAVTCKKFGHKPARGSSTRGGKQAMVEVIKNMKLGYSGALTVDGPKGPPFVVKPGVVEIARICQCAIIPLSPYAEHAWITEKSWDQFRIPKPFTKIIIYMGKPIYIKENLTREEFDAYSILIAEKITQGEQMAISHLKNSK